MSSKLSAAGKNVKARLDEWEASKASVKEANDEKKKAISYWDKEVEKQEKNYNVAGERRSLVVIAKRRVDAILESPLGEPVRPHSEIDLQGPGGEGEGEGADPEASQMSAESNDAEGVGLNPYKVGFVRRLTVLWELRRNEPPAWPLGTLKERRDAERVFGLSVSHDDEERSSRRTGIFLFVYVVTFIVAMIVPLLALVYKLLLSRDLHNYYSTKRQRSAGAAPAEPA